MYRHVLLGVLVLCLTVPRVHADGDSHLDYMLIITPPENSTLIQTFEHQLASCLWLHRDNIVSVFWTTCQNVSKQQEHFNAYTTRIREQASIPICTVAYAQWLANQSPAPIVLNLGSLGKSGRMSAATPELVCLRNFATHATLRSYKAVIKSNASVDRVQYYHDPPLQYEQQLEAEQKVKPVSMENKLNAIISGSLLPIDHIGWSWVLLYTPTTQAAFTAPAPALPLFNCSRYLETQNIDVQNIVYSNDTGVEKYALIIVYPQYRHPQSLSAPAVPLHVQQCLHTHPVWNSATLDHTLLGDPDSWVAVHIDLPIDTNASKDVLYAVDSMPPDKQLTIKPFPRKMVITLNDGEFSPLNTSSKLSLFKSQTAAMVYVLTAVLKREVPRVELVPLLQYQKTFLRKLHFLVLVSDTKNVSHTRTDFPRVLVTQVDQLCGIATDTETLALARSLRLHHTTHILPISQSSLNWSTARKCYLRLQSLGLSVVLVPEQSTRQLPPPPYNWQQVELGGTSGFAKLSQVLQHSCVSLIRRFFMFSHLDNNSEPLAWAWERCTPNWLLAPFYLPMNTTVLCPFIQSTTLSKHVNIQVPCAYVSRLQQLQAAYTVYTHHLIKRQLLPQHEQTTTSWRLLVIWYTLVVSNCILVCIVLQLLISAVCHNRSGRCKLWAGTRQHTNARHFLLPEIPNFTK
jgi:hypothetical protein